MEPDFIIHDPLETVVLPVPLDRPDDHFELGGWPALYARWASHTGFWSLCGHPGVQDQRDDRLRDFAIERYENHAAMPYVVGRWDAEGWSVLRQSYKTSAQMFRLPRWASPVIVNALRDAFGATLECEVSGDYVFPVDFSEDQARRALAPLLEPRTRLADEQLLADKISRSGVIAERSQISLF